MGSRAGNRPFGRDLPPAGPAESSRGRLIFVTLAPPMSDRSPGAILTTTMEGYLRAIAAFVVCLALAGCWGGHLDPVHLSPTAHDLLTGTVLHQDIEGGFFGIVGDDSVKYDPVELAPAFQKDGLRVKFSARPTNATTMHMWGKAVELKSIESPAVRRAAGRAVRPALVSRSALFAGCAQDPTHLDLDPGGISMIATTGTVRSPGSRGRVLRDRRRRQHEVRPVEIAPEFQKDGLRVKFSGRPANNGMSTHMWGVRDRAHQHRLLPPPPPPKTK